MHKESSQDETGISKSKTKEFSKKSSKSNGKRRKRSGLDN